MDLYDNLNDKTPGEIADILESMPLNSRHHTWQSIDNNVKSSILPILNEQVRNSLLDQMSSNEIIEVAEKMRPSSVVSIIENLPDASAKELIQNLNIEEQTKVEFSLTFEHDQIGRLLNFQVVCFDSSDSVDKVLNALNKMKIPTQTDQIFVINTDKTYLGSIQINDLLSFSSSSTLESLIDKTKNQSVNDKHNIHDLVHIFRTEPFVMKAVINDKNQLVGRITLNKMMTYIREDTENQIMNSAGLNEQEDLFAPVFSSAKKRAFWLGLNLVTAFLASYVIGFYEATLEKVVALAVLMPIVASMGGITGSQSLTLVIRGLALDHINSKNLFALFKKEISVSILNAILWAVTVGAITYFWFNDYMLSMIIGISLMVNTIIASATGVYLPVILKKMDIDPALSGAVILTTVTDIVGFFTFLGLGTLLLLN